MSKEITIKSLKSSMVLDSRGNPTVESTVTLTKGKQLITSSAMVPSGASTGKYEALELRDGGNKFHGKGVSKAINNTKKIESLLKRKKIQNNSLAQKYIDKEILALDGTINKSNLGANSILGSSMAFSRSFAKYNNLELYESLNKTFKEILKETAKDITSKNSYIENVNIKTVSKRLNEFTKEKKFIMPIPFANIINGGKHAGNPLEFQEFMIAPVKAKSFSEGARIISETYHTLKSIIGKKYGKNATAVGDEGGFAPNLKTPDAALKLIQKSLVELGYEKKVAIAMDPAASEFHSKFSGRDYYKVHWKLSSKKTLEYYKLLLETFNVISLEDAFDQDDFNSFEKITHYIQNKNFKTTKNIFGCKQIVGDDLLVTNKERIKHAINQKLCNSLLLKINQIGTITESLESASLARLSGWTTMVSHRSGETEDSYIADLSVGIGSGQIKLGAPCRGERVAKYNRLLKIEEELGKKAKYNQL